MSTIAESEDQPWVMSTTASWARDPGRSHDRSEPDAIHGKYRH